MKMKSEITRLRSDLASAQAEIARLKGTHGELSRIIEDKTLQLQMLHKSDDLGHRAAIGQLDRAEAAEKALGKMRRAARKVCEGAYKGGFVKRCTVDVDALATLRSLIEEKKNED